MPIIHSTPISMQALGFAIDADLDLSGYVLKVDHIEESTAGHGVVIDNVLEIAAASDFGATARKKIMVYGGGFSV